MAVSSLWHRWAGVPVALLALAGLVGCNKTPPAKMAKNARVIVTTPITDTVIDYQDFTGRLDAIKTIEIRARVTGYVTAIPFKEGDLVSEETLLAEIAKKPYQADLNLAQANVNLAIAERNLQKNNLDRMRKAQPSVSTTELETAEATYQKAIASVEAMEAAKKRAELYVDYTRVTI